MRAPDKTRAAFAMLVELGEAPEMALYLADYGVREGGAVERDIRFRVEVLGRRAGTG